MSQYAITIQETRTVTVIVTANDRQEAMRTAEEKSRKRKWTLMRRTPVSVTRLDK